MRCPALRNGVKTTARPRGPRGEEVAAGLSAYCCWGVKEGAVGPFCPEPGRGCGGLGLGLGLEWKRQKKLSDGWESHLGAHRSCSGRAVVSKCTKHPLLAPLGVGRG